MSTSFTCPVTLTYSRSFALRSGALWRVSNHCSGGSIFVGVQGMAVGKLFTLDRASCRLTLCVVLPRP
jgi:hypothetical protein